MFGHINMYLQQKITNPLLTFQKLLFLSSIRWRVFWLPHYVVPEFHVVHVVQNTNVSTFWAFFLFFSFPCLWFSFLSFFFVCLSCAFEAYFSNSFSFLWCYIFMIQDFTLFNKKLYTFWRKLKLFYLIN